jgi:uncharacterized lipoprotein YddW (UPF0748 family)
MVGAFEEKHGRDARELSNDDPQWLRFRSDYITLFLEELRTAVKDRDPDAVFSTTFIASEPEEYIKVMQDWSEWLDRGLVDEFYIWFRTTTNLAEVESQTRHAADVIRGRCPLIAQLSCYHPGSFQDSQLLLEAARRAKWNGADHVGVYRSHAVEQLDMWHVLDEIGNL